MVVGAMIQTEDFPHVLIGTAGVGYQLRERCEYDVLKTAQSQGWPIAFVREDYLVWWLDNRHALEEAARKTAASLRRVKEKQDAAREAQWSQGPYMR